MISILVSKAKKKPKFISELFSNRDLKESKKIMVQEVVEEMRDNKMSVVPEAEVELGKLDMLGVGQGRDAGFGQDCCFVAKDVEAGLQGAR